MNSERIFATYLIETPQPLERAIVTIAGEQSSGTFVAVPGETPELQRRHRAQIEHIEPLDTVAEPSLRGARMPSDQSTLGRCQRAKFTLSFPFENVGANLIPGRR